LKSLVIVGAGETGEIACHYFERDTDYHVISFVVERNYLNVTNVLGKPVFAFEDILDRFPPDSCHLYVALAYGKLNTQRADIFKRCKEMGYTLATYVSPFAYCDNTAQLGENCFIFEHNTIQYHAEIGNNTVLWSGNHVGHRSVIRDHCWLTSHIVVSGYCEIGEYSFLGVNSTLGDHVQIPRESWVAAGALLIKSPENVAGHIYVGAPAKPMAQSVYEKFDLEKEKFQ
jgi:sugar O-acyltransferase (sialic acid O-acetyltransferase NeuD family)